MVDVTLFSGEADFTGSTFNAPFASSNGEEPEEGGSRLRPVFGLGFALGAAAVTGIVLAVRRLRSRGDDEPGPAVEEEDSEPTAAVDDTPAVSKAAVGAMVGLAFLVAVTVLVKRNREESVVGSVDVGGSTVEA